MSSSMHICKLLATPSSVLMQGKHSLTATGMSLWKEKGCRLQTMMQHYTSPTQMQNEEIIIRCHNKTAAYEMCSWQAEVQLSEWSHICWSASSCVSDYFNWDQKKVGNQTFTSVQVQLLAKDQRMYLWAVVFFFFFFLLLLRGCLSLTKLIQVSGFLWGWWPV